MLIGTSYHGISMASVKLSDIIQKYEDSSSGDFSEWLEKLELVAKLQDITELQTFLPLFLAGPAFAVYKQLSESDKETYESLKAALLVAFGVNCYAAYDQLQKRVLQEGEPVDVYLADIKRLVAQMGQQDAEPLLKCAFMAGLPVEINMQLRSLACVERLCLSELVTRARMMMSTKNSELACASGAVPKSRSGCFTCGNPKHRARDSPKKQVRKCYACGEPGHFARQCLKKVSWQGNDQGGASAPDVPPHHQ